MFFGKVFEVYQNHCRIIVFCKCEYTEKKIININYDVEKYVGHSKCVFVPNNNTEKLKSNQLIFFTAKENEKSFKKGKDEYLLKKKLDYSLAIILKSKLSEISTVGDEKFNNKNITEKTKVYIKIDKKIYGQFEIKKSNDIFKIASLSNKTTVSCWNYEFELIKIDGCPGIYYSTIESIHSLKEENEIDFSTNKQLKNWFKKKLKYLGDLPAENIKNIISTAEKALDSETDVTDIQRWRKIKNLFESLMWDFDEIKALGNNNNFKTFFSNEIKKHKDRFIELKTNPIKEEIKKKKLKLSAEISIAKRELQSIIENKEKELETKKILDDVVDRFETNRDEIIENLMLYQSFMPNPMTTSTSIAPLTEALSFNSNVETPSTKEFVKNIKNNYSENSIDVGAKEIFGMIASLSLYKGMFVPSLYWSRLYSNAHPLYEHFTITVDPSWKGIHDLWKSYLENIVSLAETNPSTKFIIHFDGINNSLPEVWMKAIHSLVAFESVRIPVEGFPIWPKNIQFFFSTADHEYAFELNEQILRLWPAITDKDVDESTIPDSFKNKREALNNEINLIRERDETEENEIVKKLLWDFPQSFRTQKRN